MTSKTLKSVLLQGAVGLVLLFGLLACATDRPDDGNQVAAVQLQVDYWDRSARSFLPIRRLFRSDDEWQQGINTEVIFAVPATTTFVEDPSQLTDVIASGLVDQGDSSINLTLPLETPIKLFAYRYVESLALSIASSNEVEYDSYGESDTFAIATDSSEESVTIFLTTNGTPGVQVTDANDTSVTSGKTFESPYAPAFTFNVKLTKKPKSDVILPLSSSDTTEGTVSPSSLTFTRTNWGVAQTVTVAGVSNSADSTSDTSNQNYTITLGVPESTDLDYSSLSATTLAMTNVDLSSAGFSIASSRTGESLIDLANPVLVTAEDTNDPAHQDTFTVVLQKQPEAQVVLPLSSSDTGEGVVSPSSLTFTTTNWNQPQTVTVTGQNDAVDEGENTLYEVRFGAVQSQDVSYAGFQLPAVPVSNLDDDTAKLLIRPLVTRYDNDTLQSGTSTPEWDPYSTLEVTEGNGPEAAFAVSLQTQPTDNVTVTLSRVINTYDSGLIKSLLPEQQVVIGSSDTSQTLTFTPANWSNEVTITVQAVDDALVEGGDANTAFPETYQYEEFLLGQTDTKDTAYQNLKRALRVFASDNDERGIQVSSSASESSQSFDYSIRLNSRPINDVTLTLTLTTGDGNLSPGTLTFTSENWDQLQTVTVTPNLLGSDGYSYGDLSFTLGVSISNSGGSGYDEIADALLFQTDNREITLKDTRAPVVSSASVQADHNIVGIGGEVTIKLVASEPLNIPDTSAVALELKTASATSRTASLSYLEALEGDSSLPNSVMVFTYTVQEGDGIAALELANDSALTGVIKDTGGSSNELVLDNATANLNLVGAPRLDGVRPTSLAVSLAGAGGASVLRGNGLFYGGSTLQDNVTLTLSASDSSGVTGYYAVLDNSSVSPLNGSESGWVSLLNPSNDNVSFDIGSGSDNKTVYVAFKDNATPANISVWTSDSAAIAPRLLASAPDNASTGLPSRTPLQLTFNKEVTAAALASSLTIDPALPGTLVPAVIPGASYADNATSFHFLAQALPDNGTTYTVTVLDNLTDVTGVSAQTPVTFTFTTADLQSSLVAWYSLDGYTTPEDQGTDNLSLSGVSGTSTADRYGNTIGALALDNYTSSFSLSAPSSLSLWAKGAGTAFGVSASDQWHHLVALDNGTVYVDGVAFLQQGDQAISGFTGALDEVRVFSSRLSAQQVQELYADPQRGLVAYYPFTDNLTSDFTGQADNLTGAPTFTLNRFEDSWAAQGAVTTPDFALTDNYTVTFWTKVDAGATGSVLQNDGTSWIDNSTVSSQGAWTFLTVMSQGGNLSVYENGVPLTPLSTSSLGVLTLGGNNVSTDDLRVYNRALTPDEVLAVMGVRDVQGPIGSFSISSSVSNDRPGVASTDNLTLTFQARDDQEVAKAWFGESLETVDQELSGSGTAWSTTTTVRLQDNTTEGERPFYVRYEDAAGLVSPLLTQSLSLDLYPPHSASVAIQTDLPFITDNNSGETPAYTSSLDVQLNLSAQDNVSIYSYQGSGNIAEDNTSKVAVTPTPQFDNASVPFRLISGDGEKTITVTYQDGVGNSVSASDNITLDTQRPVGSVRVVDNRSVIRGSDNLSLVLTATDERSSVWGYQLQAVVGNQAPVLPDNASGFTKFTTQGPSVSEQVTFSPSGVLGTTDQTDNLTLYAWFLDGAGNLSSALAQVAPASDFDNSSGGTNDNASVDNAYDRLYVDNTPPTGSVQFDNLTSLDNTTVRLTLSLQDDHGLYAYWKSNTNSLPSDNATECGDLNLTDDDSDCWQVLTDNASLLQPAWPDHGLTTKTIPGVEHTLASDTFSPEVFVYGQDLAGNVALLGSSTVTLDPVAITTSDNFTGITRNYTIADNTTSEAGQNRVLQVRLAHIPATSDGVQVIFNLSDQSEASFAEGSSVKQETIQFFDVDWQSAQAVTVYGVDDDIDDDNQTYTLSWSIEELSGSAPEWQNLPGGTQTLVNVDNDTAGYVVTVTDNTTSEAGDEGTLQVHLTSQPFRLDTDTADQPNGFVAVTSVTLKIQHPEQARFPALTTEDSKKYQISSDNQSLTVTFRNNTDWSTGFPVRIQGLKADHFDEGSWGRNDQEYLESDRFEVLATVNQSSSGAELQDAKYAAGALDNQTVSLWNTDNDTAGVVVTALDNSSTEDGNPGRLEIMLRSRPFDNVTLHLMADNASFLDELRGLTLSPATLTFDNSTDNWSTAQVVQVLSEDDSIDEGAYGRDNQTFDVWLDSVTAVLTGTATGNNDQKYADNVTALWYQGVEQSVLSLASTDNDTAGVVVTALDNSSTEDGNTGRLDITLRSRPEGTVTVNLWADNDSGRGITLSPVALTFDNGTWSTAQTVQVLSTDDSFDEGQFGVDNQTFLVWIDNATGTGTDQKYADNVTALRYQGVDQSTLSLASTDNDTAGVVVVSYDNSSAEDGSDNGSLVLRLQSRPFDNVTLALRQSGAGLGLTLSPATLTFDNSTSNWSTGQTVQITSTDDSVDEGVRGSDNQTFVLALDNITVTSGVTEDAKFVDNVSAAGQLVQLGSLVDNLTMVDNLTAFSLDNDTARIRLTVTKSDAKESGDNATVSIRLESEPYDNVTVSVQDNSTLTLIGLKLNATNPSTLTFGPDNWSTEQTMTLVPEDDAYDEGAFGPDNQSFLVSLQTVQSADALYNGDNATRYSDNVTIQVEDNDTAGVVVVSYDNSSAEDGSDNGSLVLRLQSRPFDNVTLALRQSGAGLGLTLSPATLTFDNSTWSTEQTVQVTSIDDAVDEGAYGADNQTFALALDNLTADHAADAKFVDNVSAAGQLVQLGSLVDNLTAFSLDNDTMGIVVVATDNASTESGTLGRLEIRLRSQPYDNLTAVFEADNGTHSFFDGTSVVTGLRLSTDNQTFTQSSVSLNFDNGSWSDLQTVWVQSIDDSVDEGAKGPDNQTFFTWLRQVDVTSSQDALYDNDTQAQQNLNLNTVGALTDNLSLVSTDNDTVGIRLAYGVTSGDNDSSEAGDNGSFTVWLNSQPLDNVTVTLSDNDTSGLRLGLTFAPGNLIFTGSNWTTVQTVTFGSQDDAIDEGQKGVDNQTFTAQVAQVVSADVLYNGDNGTAVSDNLTGLVSTDNDTVGVLISITDNTSTEAGDNATFTVRLQSRPYDTVTLRVQGDNATSANGDNLGIHVSPELLTFDNGSWSLPQTVSVLSWDDHVDEGNWGSDNQTFLVHLVSSTDNGSSGTLYDNLTATRLILNGSEVDNLSFVSTDNDSAGVVLGYGDNASSEAGDNGSFTVQLNSQPLDNVTFSFQDNDTSGLSLGLKVPGVTFTGATDNWSSPQTVSFAAHDDDYDEGSAGADNQTFTLSVSSIQSADARYNGDNGTAVSDNLTGLVATDNDTVGVFVVLDNTSKESGDNGTLTVRLRSRPFDNLTVFFTADNASGLGITLSPSSLSFDNTSGNWSTAQVIQVVSIDDQVDEGSQGPGDNQTFAINLDSIAVNDGTADALYDNTTIAFLSLGSIGNELRSNTFQVASLDNDTAGLNVAASDRVVREDHTDNATLTVSLNSEPQDNVTVSFNSDNVTYGGSAIPETLIFGPGNWSKSRTVTIVATDDFVDDGNDLAGDNTTFVIRIDNTTSGDNKYALGQVVLMDNQTGNLTFTAVDNDTVGINLVAMDNATSEAGDNGTLLVTLNSQPWPGETITVQLYGIDANQSSNENGKYGIRLNGLEGVDLTFDNGSWNQTENVTISAFDDPVDEGEVGPDNQTFTVAVKNSYSSSGADSKYNDDHLITTYGGTIGKASYLVEDNDTRGLSVTIAGDSFTLDNHTIQVFDNSTADNGTASPYLVREDQSDNLTITAVLRSKPTTTVNLNFEIVDNSTYRANDTAGKPELSLDRYSLSFTTSNWSTPQTVIVSANDEQFDLDNKSFAITFSSSGGTLYGGNDALQGQVNLIKVDNDTSSVVLTTPDNATSEDNASNTGTVQVALTSQPLYRVAVKLQSDNTTAGVEFSGSDTLVFTSDNWKTPQTLSFQAVDDALDEGTRGPDNQTFHLSILRVCSDSDDDFDVPQLIEHVTANSGPCKNSAADTKDKYSSLLDVDSHTDNVTVWAEDNDTARVRWTLVNGDNATSEDNASNTAVLSVVLESQPYDNTTVSLRSSDNVTGVALSSSALVFATDNWSQAQSVTLTAVDDDYDEGSAGADNQTFRVFVDNVTSTDTKYNLLDGEALLAADNGSGSVVLGQDNFSIAALDNDTVGVLVILDNSSKESGDNGTLTVRLRSRPFDNVTVVFTADNASGRGVYLSPDNLTFGTDNASGQVWNSPRKIQVVSNVDHIDEGVQGRGDNQTFNVSLDSTVVDNGTADALYDNTTIAFLSLNDWKGAFDNNTFQVASLDNDSAGYRLASLDNVSSEAGGDNGSFTVVLTSRPLDNVTLFLSDNDTSGLGLGLTFIPDNLTFDNSSDNWSQAQTVTFQATDDAYDEGQKGDDNQTFTAFVSQVTSVDAFYNADNATNQGDNLTGLVATDNDTVGVFVVLDNTSKESGDNGTLTVRLRSRPFDNLTVSFTADNASGLGITLSPSSLSFDNTSGNWSTAQVIQVVSNVDHVDEGQQGLDNQTFAINLDSIAVDNDTADALYDNTTIAFLNLGSTELPSNTFQVASLDNDTATVSIHNGTDNVTEDNQTGTFLVSLTAKPLGTVTVGLSSSDNATGGDVLPDNRTLTFNGSNWLSVQTVTVAATLDFIDDDNVTFVISADNVTSDNASDVYANGTLFDNKSLFANTVDNLTFTAVDNDTVGITLTLLNSDNSTSESGDNATFSVVLNSEPTDNVTLTLGDNDTSGRLLGLKLIPDNLTFASVNWNVAQTVTVAAQPDQVDEGAHGPDNQTFLVSVKSLTSTDPKYGSLDNLSQNGGQADNLSFLAEDNDTAFIRWELVNNALKESGDNGTIRISLSSAPTDNNNTTLVDNVTVTLGSSDNTTGFNLVWNGTKAQTQTLTFTSDNASTWGWQTVTLEAVDDAYDEGVLGLDNQSFLAQILSTSSADAMYDNASKVISGGVDNFTIQVLDNDTAGIVLTVTDNNSKESGDNGTLTVQLQSRPWDNVTTTWTADNHTVTLADGTLVPTGLYLSPTALTFGTDNWSTAQTLTVVSYQDHISEGTQGLDNQTFTVSLVASDNSSSQDELYDNNSLQLSLGDLLVDNVSMASLDNDSAGVLWSLTDNFTAEDNATDNGTVVVSLSSRPYDNITVALQVQNILAADGSDPVATEVSFDNTTVTFTQSVQFTSSNWDQKQTVTFWAIDDQVDENALGPDNHTVTLFVDNVTVVDNATTDLHFVYAYASPSFTVDNLTAVVGDNDTAGVLLSWKDGDNQTSEGGDTATVMARLTSRPYMDNGASLKVRLKLNELTSVSNQNAYFESPSSAYYLRPLSWGNLTFPAIPLGGEGGVGFYVDLEMYANTWSSGLEKTIVGLDNLVRDGNTLGRVSAVATEVYSPLDFSHPDPIYDGLVKDNQTLDNISFTNVDNETNLALGVSKSSVSVSENGTTDNFTVVLSQRPSDNVTVTLSDNFTYSDDIQLSGQDGQDLRGNPLTFTTTGQDNYTVVFRTESVIQSITANPLGTWSLPQTVTVSAVNDNRSEGNQTGTLTLTAFDNQTQAADNQTVQATVVDDDVAGIAYSWLNSDNFTTEDNKTAQLLLKLTSLPFNQDNGTGVDVTVHLNVRGKDNHSVSFSTDNLTFTSGNWNSEQTVTVSAVNDAYDEGQDGPDNQSYQIYIDNVTSGDSVYAAMTAFTGPDMATVVVEDNDLAGIGVELISADNSSFVALNVYLLSQPMGTDNVTVNLTGFGTQTRFTDNGSDLGNAVNTLPVTLSWADNATVYVTNTSQNLDNESDDDDQIADGWTLFSFYGTATTDNTSSSYHGKQIAKTLIRTVGSGEVYTDFDNGTALPK